MIVATLGKTPVQDIGKALITDYCISYDRLVTSIESAFMKTLSFLTILIFHHPDPVRSAIHETFC